MQKSKENDFVIYRLARWFSPSVCLFAVAAMAGGCGPKKFEARDIPAPPLPPLPPYEKPMALDPALRQAARDRIEAGLSDPNELTRTHSLEAVSEVARSDPDGPNYEPAVLKLLHDDAEIVRFSAAMTAGRLKMQSAHQTLLGMLDDPSLKVQVAVRFALHMLGDKRHSHDLEHFAADPDPTVRGATAEVLGSMNEPSAVRLLLPMRRDYDARVRQQAAEALWRLGNDQGRDDLVALTVSRYPDDEMIGLLGLAEPHDKSVSKTIFGDLTSESESVALVAARALGMLGWHVGLGVALKGADSADPHERFLAALALGAIGRPDEQPALATLLKDSSPAVQIAAAEGILQLHE
jgi:HEAT repeat protein